MLKAGLPVIDAMISIYRMLERAVRDLGQRWISLLKLNKYLAGKSATWLEFPPTPPQARTSGGKSLNYSCNTAVTTFALRRVPVRADMPVTE